MTFSGSKWVDLPLLLDVSELEDLFQHLSPFFLQRIGVIDTPEKIQLNPASFLDAYKEYLHALKASLPFQEGSFFRSSFRVALSRTQEAIFLREVSGGRVHPQIKEPVVFVRFHAFTLSKEVQKIKACMPTFAAISWGLSFSFPMLFEIDQKVYKTADSTLFPTTELFNTLKKWVRRNTVPVSFLFDDIVLSSSERVGKSLQDWCENHPQLSKQKIRCQPSFIKSC